MSVRPEERPKEGPDERPQPFPADEPADIQAALAEARRAATRKYYDAELDVRNGEAYYRDIDTHAGPAELYDALSRLVSSTHTTRLRYQPSRLLYPWVDLQPNRKLRSIYSGQEFEPEELIREDFRIELARSARLREIMTAEATFTAERIALELDALEAAMPFNCEHVVPQSWFGKDEPMRGDLHHLFACESGCNNFRGNTPYFDFPDFQEVVRGNCGKLEASEKKFEPGAGKGAVARATLYFLLRYPGEINRSNQEYTEDRLRILLKWHTEEPPGDYERHRNMAIFEAQGNRNPLIDEPSWALINFSRGLG
jgi:endonuclease I